MTNVFLAVLILAAGGQVQTDVTAPEADLLYTCDFEESTDRNYDCWPDDWTRRRGHGYPVYLPVDIVDDDPSPTPANRCLQITLDGGAAQLYSPPIPVQPQFSYQLTGRLRTQGLKYDLVSCTLAFYDGAENLLEIHESTPVRDAAQWQQFRIGPVTPMGIRVRTAVVSIHVRPTDQADLTGACLIDDLRVGRLPKMSVEIGAENGIFTDPQDVLVHCRVSGFKAAQPAITFELLDVYGTSLNKTEERMQPEAGAVRDPHEPGTPQHGFAGSTVWKPPIAEPGFYQVRVSTPNHSELLLEESVSFVVLPPLRRGHRGEFGWSLPDGDRQIPVRSIPALLSEVGVHWIKYPVWFNNREMKRADEIAWLVERLSSFDIQLIGLLDQPPEEVRTYFGSTGRIPVATAFSEKAVWHPALDPVMTRLSLKIRWWQLGGDDDTSFASYPDLTTQLKEIRDDLANFGQRVNVGIPWRAMEEDPVPALGSWAFLSYFEDLPFTSDELQSYASAEPDGQAHRWIMLEPLSQHHYDLENRARDLVQRMVAARVAKAGAIFVPDPFHKEHGLMPNGSPGPLLLVWRTAATLIGGGSYAGQVRLPNRSENRVFLQESAAVMVVWNDLATTESIYLGENVRQFDVWGRELPANHGQIVVGPMPTYVTGVNSALVQWRRDFRFETDRLASIFGREQSVAYRFTNFFPQGVSGRVRFRLPSEWKTDSADRSFKLAPGETLRDSLRVLLGADATSGPQPVQVDFEITGDENHAFSLHETIQVGLGDVLVHLETRLDEAGNLIVDQHLTNNTDDKVNFKFYLSAPGRRRERRQVFNQGRGRITNNYLLPNGRELLGQTLWLRAEEINGARILNSHIVAHE